MILKGDNPVVDRRSITFSAKTKDKDAGTQTAQNENTGPVSTDVEPVGTAPPFIPQEGFQKTDEEQIKTKPGGCGCDVVGMAPPGVTIFGTALALGAIAARRRKNKNTNA
jgi:MYXO-CTERM domain-containing protein